MSYPPLPPQGQTYPPGQPQPQAAGYPLAGYGYPLPPAPGARTSVGGPRAMTLIGAVLVLVAIVLLALGLPAIFSTVPLHVVDSAGNPGSATIATLHAPGTTTVHLEPGYYDVDVASKGAFGELGGTVAVVGADGGRVTVDSPTVTSTFTMLNTYVISAATFHVSEAGDYTITAPEVSPEAAQVLLAHGKDPSTLAGAGLELLGAIVVGASGLGLGIGGGIWWGSRVRNRKRLDAWQSHSASPYSPVAGLPPR